MSAKTSAARREAFFRALAETGNRTIAAERAKVSQSWVTLHRAQDPEFRARMAAAVAGAKDRLRAGGVAAPPSGWGSLDGEELVVRGGRRSRGRESGNGRRASRRASSGSWRRRATSRPRAPKWG